MAGSDLLDKLTQNVLLNPDWQEVLAIVKGARNGFVYGCKIRFPHALVMSFLFREGSWVIRYFIEHGGSGVLT